MAQEKLGAALLQPAGRRGEIGVTLKLVAAASKVALPVSVVKFTLTDCVPAPTAALICPDGNAVATTLSAAMA